MKFAYPEPKSWNEVYIRLLAAWKQQGGTGEKPPAPLVFSNEAFLSEKVKAARWIATIEWAKARNLMHVVANHSMETDLIVQPAVPDNIGNTYRQPYAMPRTHPNADRPIRSPQRIAPPQAPKSAAPLVRYRQNPVKPEAKVRPSREQLQDMLEQLHCRWEQIAGDVLSSHCKPLHFDGKKARRLILEADHDFVPPWGRWNAPADEAGQIMVKALRLAINDIIAPHSVDRIDFVPREKTAKED